jgi:hypothetical protein
LQKSKSNNIHATDGYRAHPASYPVGTMGLSLVVKQQGHEANHLPPSSAKIKECMELYLHFPNMSSWCDASVKHRDNFTLPAVAYHTVALNFFFKDFLPLTQNKMAQ